MVRKQTTQGPDRDEDEAHWRKLAETVTPLRRNRRKPKTAGTPADPAPPSERGPENAKRPPPRRAPAQNAPVGKPVPANLDGRGFGGISRADARRVKSGNAHIDDKIDLHGMTLAEAEMSLRRFILDAASSGARTVLVVTGKGLGGKGVIRQHLPVWLHGAPLQNRILAYCHAQPRDGGSGAYYVRLRGK